MENRRLIGRVNTVSGRLLLIDPWLLHPQAEKQRHFILQQIDMDWEDFSSQLMYSLPQEYHGRKHHGVDYPNAGLLLRSGSGEGRYHVYADVEVDYPPWPLLVECISDFDVLSDSLEPVKSVTIVFEPLSPPVNLKAILYPEPEESSLIC